jgi:hypothetical protein
MQPTLNKHCIELVIYSNQSECLCFQLFNGTVEAMNPFGLHLVGSLGGVLWRPMPVLTFTMKEREHKVFGLFANEHGWGIP